MHLIAKVIRISRVKFHCNSLRPTTVVVKNVGLFSVFSYKNMF